MKFDFDINYVNSIISPFVIEDISENEEKRREAEGIELCEKNKYEIEISSGVSAREELKRSIQVTKTLYCISLNGKIGSVFGINYGENAAYPWLLGDDKIQKQASMQYYRASRYFIECLKKMNIYLENYLPSTYKDTIKWLSNIGFHIDQEKINMNGVEYIRFSYNPKLCQ